MEFEGIVIRRTQYKEGAMMITVLTEERLRSFLAKGVMKITSKNASSVNLFTKSKFQIFHGKDGDWLRVGEIVESFPNIQSDLEKLGILDFISEITNALLQTSDAKNIYKFLELSLTNLNKDFSPWTIAAIYFAKVLSAAGYGLDVDNCALCGKKEIITTLSYKDGGFICKNCFDENRHLKMNTRKLKMIRYLFKVDYEHFNSITFSKDECKDVIFEFSEFINHVSQIDIKSLSLLKNL